MLDIKRNSSAFKYWKCNHLHSFWLFAIWQPLRVFNWTSPNISSLIKTFFFAVRLVLRACKIHKNVRRVRKRWTTYMTLSFAHPANKEKCTNIKIEGCVVCVHIRIVQANNSLFCNNCSHAIYVRVVYSIYKKWWLRVNISELREARECDVIVWINGHKQLFLFRRCAVYIKV